MSKQTSTSNYDLYKVFYYVAKEKSLTKAAKALDVTQPAVSQSMKMLEAMLGVKLTNRCSHGIKLTKEGELIYPHIKKGCQAFMAAEQELLKVPKTMPSNKESSPALKEPKKKYVTDCFITGVQYSHFKGQKLPYRLLEHLPIILTRDDETRKNLDKFLLDNGISIKTFREYDTKQEVLEHVIHNEGIGCIPLDCAKEAIEKKDAFVLEFEKTLPNREA